MPFYKYICKKCDKQHTVMKKISEYDREEHCPDCNEILVRDPKDMVCGYECKCSGFYGKVSK